MRVRFGRPSDPIDWSLCRKEYSELLQDGAVYEVDRIEVHTWHTRYYLKGFDVPFNSVWFVPVDGVEQCSGC
jgi:hypothetical protein